MLNDVFILTFLLFIAGCSLAAALHHLSRCRYLTILDVQKVLRPAQSDRVLNLLDSRVEDIVRPIFTRRKFEDSQLMTLYEIREHLLRMAHNAFVLLVWA